jgi:hypothetical protein
MYSAQESGIGGFLLLFVLSQLLSLCAWLYKLPTFWNALAGPNAATVQRIYAAYPAVASMELFGDLARIACGVIGLVLIFRRDRRAPVFYTVFLAANIVFVATDMLFGQRFHEAILAYLVAHGQPTANSQEIHDKARLGNYRAIGYSVIWFLYWRSSERVRLTFAPATSPQEIPGTDAPRT